ncbi:hypothetical protein EB796_005391 [Bugula neritina]|uniref:Uncharacterized protein n=1 Tax=Bugula neritina TaxID=10212 RepID=A0A7J7KDN4_BUGNE|nr:hypothetical protein EB796_005391 [Bugula neritina]
MALSELMPLQYLSRVVRIFYVFTYLEKCPSYCGIILVCRVVVCVACSDINRMYESEIYLQIATVDTPFLLSIHSIGSQCTLCI